MRYRQRVASPSQSAFPRTRRSPPFDPPEPVPSPSSPAVALAFSAPSPPIPAWAEGALPSPEAAPPGTPVGTGRCPGPSPAVEADATRLAIRAPLQPMPDRDAMSWPFTWFITMSLMIWCPSAMSSGTTAKETAGQQRAATRGSARRRLSHGTARRVRWLSGRDDPAGSARSVKTFFMVVPASSIKTDAPPTPKPRLEAPPPLRKAALTPQRKRSLFTEKWSVWRECDRCAFRKAPGPPPRLWKAR